MLATWGGQPNGRIRNMPAQFALDIPYTFVPGTVADANQVNANFDALSGFLNTNGPVAITQNMTFYVAPTGVDAPTNGTSPSTPCATIQYLYNLLRGYWIRNSSAQVVIQLAPGNYTGAAINGALVGLASQIGLIIQGDATGSNPMSYVINDLVFNHGAMATLQGITLTSSTGDALFVGYGSQVQLGLSGTRVVDFGQTTSGSHIHADRGGMVTMGGNYSVSGGAFAHWRTQSAGSQIWATLGPAASPPQNPGPIITINGNPTFSGAFGFLAGNCNVTMGNVVFVNPGNAIGLQYNVANAQLITGGVTLPGNAAGIISDGGIVH